MSLSGMTGFHRVDGALGAWSWSVEARSVNGRNLDTRFRGPPGFDSLERLAREGAQQRFQRGQVTIGLQARRAEAAALIQVNEDVLARYAQLAAGLVAAGRAAPPAADGLLALKGVLEAGEDDDAETRAPIEAAMAASLAAALDGLKQSRMGEGAALEPVLEGVLGKIESLVAAAEAEAGAQVAAIRERFARRMGELLGDSPELQERIVLEAAALAVKADVREELDRLTAHVGAARALIALAGTGRKLDFLAQEFMREANTLCSKSATNALTAVGLELKAAVEQLREQVQNVE